MPCLCDNRKPDRVDRCHLNPLLPAVCEILWAQVLIYAATPLFTLTALSETLRHSMGQSHLLVRIYNITLTLRLQVRLWEEHNEKILEQHVLWQQNSCLWVTVTKLWWESGQQKAKKKFLNQFLPSLDKRSKTVSDKERHIFREYIKLFFSYLVDKFLFSSCFMHKLQH